MLASPPPDQPSPSVQKGQADDVNQQECEQRLGGQLAKDAPEDLCRPVRPCYLGKVRLIKLRFISLLRISE